MHPNGFRIGIGQIDCAVGDVQQNLELIAEYVERAESQGVELLVFPELALTGYSVGNRFPDVALKVDSPEIDRLMELSRRVAIAAGYIEESHDARFFNSAIYLEDGRIVHIHRKVYPPTYGMFDERRYFGAGRDVSAFDTRFGRMAMLVCGDCWHLPLPYLAAHDGADVLLVLAASSDKSLSADISCRRSWERLNQSYALTLSCFVVFANRVGVEGQLHFWGGSHVVLPNSDMLVQGKIDEPDLVPADLDLALVRKQRIILPFRRDDNLEFTVRLGQRLLQSIHYDRPHVLSDSGDGQQ